MSGVVNALLPEDTMGTNLLTILGGETFDHTVKKFVLHFVLHCLANMGSKSVMFDIPF
jgi:hypothetical protein